MGAGDSNSGLPTLAASAFPIELSSQLKGSALLTCSQAIFMGLAH